MANVLSTSYSITKGMLNHPLAEHCEHILGAKAQAYACFCEDDSFGPLVRYFVCQPCHDKAIEEHHQQKTCCNDCKQMVLNSKMRQWRWYDFYAAQGDEPLDICDDCWTGEKHQKRMKQDKLDAQDEEEYYDY